jgi:hypothetical protein
MLTLIVVLSVLAISTVLMRELLVEAGKYRRAQAARRRAAVERLRAERRLHQLTQDAVAQMLEAVRRR